MGSSLEQIGRSKLFLNWLFTRLDMEIQHIYILFFFDFIFEKYIYLISRLMLPNTPIHSHCLKVWTRSITTTHGHVGSCEFAIQRKDHQHQPVNKIQKWNLWLSIFYFLQLFIFNPIRRLSWTQSISEFMSFWKWLTITSKIHEIHMKVKQIE